MSRRARSTWIALTASLALVATEATPARAQLETGFAVVPPDVATTAIEIELRLGLRNLGAAAASYLVTFQLDPATGGSTIATQNISVNPGSWQLASAWLDAATAPGAHQLGYRVEQSGQTVATGTWPIYVRSLADPTPPLLLGAWHEPGAYIPGAYPSARDATQQDVRDHIAALAAVGTKTVIVGYVEAIYSGAHAFYPSAIPELGGMTLPFDVIGAILEEADAHDMHVFLGLGRGPAPLVFFPGPDEQKVFEAVDLGFRVASELIALYGAHPSLYGWYLSHEVDFLAGASLYVNLMTLTLDSLGPHRPVMIAPTGTPLLLSTEGVLASEADIFNYQDAVGAGYIPYVYTFDPEQRIAMLDDIFSDYAAIHAGTRKHLWADLEVWQMDGPAYANAYPAAFERVLRQIELEAPYAEMLTAYAGPGFLEDPASTLDLGGPAAETLYTDYQAYESEHGVDSDGDGVFDASDNCVAVANAAQLDANQDGFGNLCDPDFDDNGVVGISDFNRLRGQFGLRAGNPAFDPAVDLNGDGGIGLPDFNLLRSGFGRPPGPSGLACAGSASCGPGL